MNRRLFMRKLVFLLSVLASLSFAGIEASLGFGPYHGIVGVGYTMMDDHFSANIHLSNFSTDYDFLGGMGVAYRFSGLSGAYVFHSSDWMTGEVEGFRIRLEDGEFADVEETCRRFDYWRLVFGLGFQYLITKHLGAYVEVGFQFLAGDGGYYTNFDELYGRLDNDKLVFPVGLGIVADF